MNLRFVAVLLIEVNFGIGDSRKTVERHGGEKKRCIEVFLLKVFLVKFLLLNFFFTLSLVFFLKTFFIETIIQ